MDILRTNRNFSAILGKDRKCSRNKVEFNDF